MTNDSIVATKGNCPQEPYAIVGNERLKYGLPVQWLNYLTVCNDSELSKKNCMCLHYLAILSIQPENFLECVTN